MYYCLKCKTSLGDDDVIIQTTEMKRNFPVCPFCKTPCLDQYEVESVQKGKGLIKELTCLVNSMSLSDRVCEEMARQLACSHRTLQQSTMRLLYGIIVQYSKILETMGTDPRNEDAKKFADQVANLKDVYFSLI